MRFTLDSLVLAALAYFNSHSTVKLYFDYYPSHRWYPHVTAADFLSYHEQAYNKVVMGE